MRVTGDHGILGSVFPVISLHQVIFSLIYFPENNTFLFSLWLNNTPLHTCILLLLSIFPLIKANLIWCHSWDKLPSTEINMCDVSP